MVIAFSVNTTIIYAINTLSLFELKVCNCNIYGGCRLLLNNIKLYTLSVKHHAVWMHYLSLKIEICRFDRKLYKLTNNRRFFKSINLIEIAEKTLV